MVENFSEEEIHLRDYLRVIFKRRWLIITVLIIVTLTVTIESFRMAPLYRATAQVLIEKENPKVVNIEEVLRVNTTDQDYYQTQYEILKSKALALKVITALNLKANPEFAALKQGFSLRAALSALVQWLKSITSSAEAKIDPQLEQDKENNSLIKAYLDRLKVEPIRNSRLVNVSFEGKDPQIVTKIANAHAQRYIESNIERKFSASQEAVGWLNQRIKEVEKKLQQTEESLQAYREKEGLVSIDFEERQGIIMQSLNDLNAALTSAQTEKIEKMQLYNELKKLSSTPDVIESFPAVVQNPLIQELKANYITLSGEYAKLSQKYGPEHPNMVRLSSEMQRVREKITQEVRRIAQSIETEYRLASEKEKAILNAMEEKKREALDLNQKQIKYDVLKREADTTQALFKSLLQRAKEATITEGLEVTNIMIVDPARIPEKPVRPKKLQNIFLALIVGLALGIGLAFFLEYLDNTIKTPDEVERYLKIPLLGVVGSFPTNVTDPKTKEMITQFEPKSTIAEAYRTIRTNILFSSPDIEKKVLLITSVLPIEGKTVLASNLAITFAKMGKNVLLIDADLRKSRIHTVFNLDRGKGLSALLAGGESTVKDTDISNLKIITSGALPPNPAELLNSKKMKELIEQIRKQYDLIIIDSPPVLSVTDPAILATLSDGVVVTIRASSTPRPAIKRGIQQLLEVGGKVLGCVLNDVNFEKESYYYSNYRYYYHYYYSEEGRPKTQGHPTEGGIAPSITL
ncbi:MAG TPA: polysaccharide biosynthesis tyrosine autokinase [Thermodesulfobacteriota bacterium]|nr:polysaccharide biosynthesis tyrosine autokinase [Thermodesulfobacteriota bacterium]